MPHLDKSSRKYICPHCGKRRFVIYLDHDNNPIDPTCGRCDRQDHCGYHYPPRDYFRDHRPLSGTSSTPSPLPRPRKLHIELPKPPSTIAKQRMGASLHIPYHHNPLFTALVRKLRGFISETVLEDTFIRYGVGTSAAARGGAVEFFQIDARGEIRTGKIMRYDSEAHRDHRIAWVHKEKEYASANFSLRQCFFGTDVAAAHPDAVLWLFESEKTALVVSAMLQRGGAEKVFIPIACGGCGGINPTPANKNDPWHAIQTLKGRKVVLFPDQGKYRDWWERAQQLKGFCSTVHIASGLEPSLHPWEYLPPRIFKGCDYADIIINEVYEGRDPTELVMKSYLFSPPEPPQHTVYNIFVEDPNRQDPDPFV